jgi:hypothetical protein
MTGTNCDLFTHNQSQSYLNHLVQVNLLVFFIKLSSVHGMEHVKLHQTNLVCVDGLHCLGFAFCKV